MATATARFPFATAALVVACLFAEDLLAQANQSDRALLRDAQGRFQPLPKDMATAEFPVTPERVELGRKLFFDPRVSVDGTVSCSRCHLPALYATDALAKSRGAHNRLVPRNAPTVLNAGLQFKQHWAGEFESLEAQAKLSLLGPAFASPDYAAAMARLKAIPGYTELFQRAFPGAKDPVNEDSWGQAIGAFERTLVTPSRFDEFLGGKTQSLTAAERQGLRTFIDLGCADCHDGPGVGGGSFEKFGVTQDYWKQTGSQEIDKGRVEATKDPADTYVFKVAGLRNVAMTPPYFHDGSVETLPAAVRVMARVQLGKELSDEQADQLAAFLQCLTGKLPADFAEAPVLPAAGFTTDPTAVAR